MPTNAHLMMLTANAVAQVLAQFPQPHEALNYLTQKSYLLRSDVVFFDYTDGIYLCYQPYEVQWEDRMHHVVPLGDGASKAKARQTCCADAIYQLKVLFGLERTDLASPAEWISQPVPVPRRILSASSSSTGSSNATYHTASFGTPYTSTLASGASSPTTERNNDVNYPQQLVLPPSHTRKEVLSLARAQKHEDLFDLIMCRLDEDLARRPSLLYLDVEARDTKGGADSHDILDVGIVVSVSGSPPLARNLVVAENKKVRNRHCVNNPDGFAYGWSEELPHHAMVAEMNQVIESVVSEGKGFIVVHTACNDKKWLEAAGVKLDAVEICDIAEVKRSWEQSINNTSLEAMSRQYGVDSASPSHNGGNDAVTTMMVFEEMMIEWQKQMEYSSVW